MTPVPSPGAPVPGASAARWAVATLDHGAAMLGYAAVPEPPPEGGGWRRLYLKGADVTLSAVGPEAGTWASLGVEVSGPRAQVTAKAADLLDALAPYEVAIDPDAGADRFSADAVVRIALRLFVEGCTPSVFRDAAGNVIEAASMARRVLGL